MANLFFHQWSELDQLNNRYPYLEDVIETLEQESEVDELTVHLLSSELPKKNQVLLVEETLNANAKIMVKVELHNVTNGSLITRQERLVSIFQELVQEEDTVFIHMGQGDLATQHAIAHLGIQDYKSQVTFLTGNGLKKRYYFNYLKPDDYMSSRRFYHHIHDYVLSSNYSAAKRLVDRELKDKRISKLLQFGYDLKELNLSDHNECFDLLKSVLIENDAESSEIRYVERMKKLGVYNQKAFIMFLYNYAEHLYEEDDLIDFLVLFYRLTEEMLLYTMGWDINYPENKERSRLIVRKNAKYSIPFPNWYVSNHFHTYLKVVKKEVRQIEKKHRNKVSIKRNKCTGLKKLSSEERYFADIYMFFCNKRLSDFLDLRHEGVSGHGFAEFSKQKFEELCGGRTPLEMLDPMLNTLNLKPEHSLFRLLQKAILASISTEIMDREQKVTSGK